MLFHSSLELIGNTPLVELSRIAIPNNNRIFAKLESYNPAGGVKDRVALHILQKAQKQGKLHKDSVVIEATAGNTGLGIAFVCLHFNIKAILVVPDKFSIEKQILMRALGAEVINTPKELGIQGAIDKAQELLDSTPHSFSLHQFENPLNPEAHYLTTAKEIYADMQGVRDSNIRDFFGDLSTTHATSNGKKSSQANLADEFCDDFKGYQAKSEGSYLNDNDRALSADSLKSTQKSLPNLDYFVCGAGSGGSFSGIAQYLKEQDSRIQAVLCDPIGSIIGGGQEGCANIEGIGNNFIPKTMDTSLIDLVQKISDEEAYQGLKILAGEEGILAGISSGACLQACLKLAQEVENKLIVTLFADDLSRYLSKNLV
ncbi:cysteine synthase family protein [Helicobacter magdeburgensis]|uniref:Cysteine synthase n=1 Tax=Helicobacter magdeburgensis TaxID=471858 RepID=A0A4V6I1A1_9HELI|nr:cysteine synthase family protein [Helicobacter magdeburgensis]TLD91512.1 cysteine synthase family protein [Helicobacter magdeburgensis]